MDDWVINSTVSAPLDFVLFLFDRMNESNQSNLKCVYLLELKGPLYSSRTGSRKVKNSRLVTPPTNDNTALRKVRFEICYTNVFYTASPH